MDQEIKRSLRKLFLKFLLLQGIILAAAVLLSVLSTGYFKQRLAQQLSLASRDSVLSGDSRQVILNLGSSVSRDFLGVTWRPSGPETGFSVPAEAGSYGRFRNASARVGLYFDDKKSFFAGEMVFFYPRWSAVLWGVLGWLAVFMLSLPVALMERRRLVRDYALMLDLRVKESFSILAAQVAHDIRSPLAALGATARKLDIPDEQRTLVDGAVGRIHAIADDLLERYRAPGTEVRPKVESCALAGLVEQVIAEKRIQHKDKAGVKIDFRAGDGIKAAVDQRELQRIVSNLVNNAVESFGKEGVVSVWLSSADGAVFLEIRDNGRGIPPETLAKLGQKGGTHGKEGGTGLGLYHARTSVESWGGSLEILSEVGKGTAITITLPAAAKPAAGLRAVLLDDDPLVHMNWKMSARAAGADLKLFKTPQELSAVAETLPRDIPLYIDSELGDGAKGEDIAKELHEKGFADISMATGHDAAKFAHLPWLKVAGKEPPWA